jgi:hypothetical protein
VPLRSLPAVLTALLLILFAGSRPGTAPPTPTRRAQITWTVPAGTPAGTYRIVHHGDAKNLLGSVTPFTGTSRTFTVNG